MTTFDPIKYKDTTRSSGRRRRRLGMSGARCWRAWLGPATELMLDMAGVKSGHRVLDVAAGAGDQTLQAAARVGPRGYVLATDISANILDFARDNARKEDSQMSPSEVRDGENLDVPPETFDVVISRVGLIYFPEQQKALASMKRALKPRGRVAAIVYSTAENNKFFSIPVSIIRRRANLPPPVAGQPGPSVSAAQEPWKLRSARQAFVTSRFARSRRQLNYLPPADCVRFEQESFGALQPDAVRSRPAPPEPLRGRKSNRNCGAFEGPSGFEGRVRCWWQSASINPYQRRSANGSLLRAIVTIQFSFPSSPMREYGRF